MNATLFWSCASGSLSEAHSAFESTPLLDHSTSIKSYNTTFPTRPLVTTELAQCWVVSSNHCSSHIVSADVANHSPVMSTCHMLPVHLIHRRMFTWNRDRSPKEYSPACGRRVEQGSQRGAFKNDTTTAPGRGLGRTQARTDSLQRSVTSDARETSTIALRDRGAITTPCGTHHHIEDRMARLRGGLARSYAPQITDPPTCMKGVCLVTSSPTR